MQNERSKKLEILDKMSTLETEKRQLEGELVHDVEDGGRSTGINYADDEDDENDEVRFISVNCIT